MASIPSGNITHDGDCIYCLNPGLYGVTPRVVEGFHLNVDVLPRGGKVACQKNEISVKPWVYLGTTAGGVSRYGPRKEPA